MKKTLIILVLLFTLFGCERNYINDYKIEGIGLEDSLLDFFSEEMILQAIKDDPYNSKNEKFIPIEFRDLEFFQDMMLYKFTLNQKTKNLEQILLME